MEKTLVFGLIKSFHDLFTALWIGGMLTTIIALIPALQGIKENQTIKKGILVTFQKNLSTVAMISIFGLWVTGMFLGKQTGNINGFLGFTNQYEVMISVKHIIVIIMIVIAVFRRFGLGRNIAEHTYRQQKVYMGLVLINALLGVIVIFLSGFVSALH